MAMRLISAQIQGYGRLVNTKVNLDAKVIAIVGPNEAGKTTLLNALAHLDSGNEVPVALHSRAGGVSDETRTTTLEYILDDDDREALADLDLHEQPTRVSFSRTAVAKRFVSLKPAPVKSVVPLANALVALKRGINAEDLDDWINPETIYADPGSDAPRDYRFELKTVIASVEAAIAAPGTSIDDEATGFAESLRRVTLVDEEGGGELRDALGTVAAWAKREHPGKAARDRTWGRSPDLLVFSEADRSIQSAYTFDEALASKPPAALQNLAGAASLDLVELHRFVATRDRARIRTAVVQANQRMDEIFADAWKQSRLSVQFDMSGDQLCIDLMEDGGNVTVFDERSAGLRTFVALSAFLKVHGPHRPPILLIDEAENHLHIDAQADLVNMFVTQEHAVKVIYTTHSPACLPPDLGTGIRTVVPRRDGSQISDVMNNFWQGAAGYSPLMLAMGAAAAAFTPARRVVLAEGATEMLLLPTLLRAATGLTNLPYQVAPGLSEVPKDFLPQLDLEAARVAYLVDGDNGGTALTKSLLAAGIPETVIINLNLPGVENALELGAYREAFTALLPECNPDAAADEFPNLHEVVPDSSESYASAITAWLDERSLKVPSKVTVANWLVQNNRAVPDPALVSSLVDLHTRLLAALDLNA